MLSYIAMKKIQHPNLGQLTWSLVPTLIFSMSFILTGSTHWWMIYAAIVFLVIYGILASYFCIKQKCYRQLSFAYATTALYAGFIALIVYINT